MAQYGNRLARTIDAPVSIAMPVSNEVEVLETVLAEFVEVIYRHLPEGSEFLIEEGGSTDGTKELLQELNERWPFLKIVYKDEKEGAAASLKAVIARATCPYVFIVDSDGQCVASEFWRLAPHAKDHDFVMGAKMVRYDPLHRRTGSRALSLMVRPMFGFTIGDINFSFRLAKREAIQRCAASAKYMKTTLNAEVALIASLLGYKTHELKVFFRPRIAGKSQAFPAGSWFRECFTALTTLLRIRIGGLKLYEGTPAVDTPSGAVNEQVQAG